MAGEELPLELVERLRERANDPLRRSDSSSMSAHTVDLGSLLGQIGPGAGPMQGFMGQFAEVMKGFGVMAPMPAGDHASGRDREPLPPPVTDDQIALAETAVGRPLPPPLRQLYAIADGGFGPGDGLFPLDRMLDEYDDMVREPAGPQNQLWPANLLPLTDRQPGYDCLDLDTGAIVVWDPEEIEGYSNAAWERSFKPEAASLAEWLEQWLLRRTAGETVQEQEDEIRRNPMEIHVKNMIESYGRMSPEERAAQGLPETGWEDEVRRRYGLA